MPRTCTIGRHERRQEIDERPSVKSGLFWSRRALSALKTGLEPSNGKSREPKTEIPFGGIEAIFSLRERE